jgi:hypothetical protein
MRVQSHVARKSVKVPAEELGWNLTLGRKGLSGLPRHKKPAPNGFAEADPIIHHLQWQHPLKSEQLLPSNMSSCPQS